MKAVHLSAEQLLLRDLLAATYPAGAAPEPVTDLDARLADALRTPDTFTLARAPAGSFVVAAPGREPLEIDVPALGPLHLAALNPRRWVGLGPTPDALAEPVLHPVFACLQPAPRTLRAWRESLRRAVEHLYAVDDALGRLFAAPGRRADPGLALRTRGGRVELRWIPPPGVRVQAVQPPT